MLLRQLEKILRFLQFSMCLSIMFTSALDKAANIIAFGNDTGNSLYSLTCSDRLLEIYANSKVFCQITVSSSTSVPSDKRGFNFSCWFRNERLFLAVERPVFLI